MDALAVATTAYILVAIQLKEGDLIRFFGDQYRRYREEVSMLIPPTATAQVGSCAGGPTSKIRRAYEDRMMRSSRSGARSSPVSDERWGRLPPGFRKRFGLAAELVAILLSEYRRAVIAERRYKELRRNCTTNQAPTRRLFCELYAHMSDVPAETAPWHN